MNVQDQMASVETSIRAVATNAGLELDPAVAKAMAQNAINELNTNMINTLKAGNPVDIYGIGQWTVVGHSAHTAYKSATGVAYTVPPYRTLKFTSTKEIKAAVKAVPA
jgi:nucleoid DNA-binding protein